MSLWVLSTAHKLLWLLNLIYISSAEGQTNSMFMSVVFLK